MSVCNFFGYNEDISILFANITHYVELIYTYHTTTYLYLHSLGTTHTHNMFGNMLCTCYVHVAMQVTCLLHAC